MLTATDMAIPALGGVRVLVVDAGADEAAALTAVLRLHGYHAQSALTAADAFALVRDLAPQVVVADLRLPDCDGIEFVRRCRAADGRPNVVVVTGRTDRRTHADVRAAGATAVLVKPADPAELVRTLVELTGGPPPKGKRADGPAGGP